MYSKYADAVRRAKSIRPLLPGGWRVTPFGNPTDGYRLGIQHETGEERPLYIESDEDVKHLLEVYIEVATRMKAEAGL